MARGITRQDAHCDRCGKTIVEVTTAAWTKANGSTTTARVLTDAFATIEILGEDGLMHRGWIPHHLVCESDAQIPGSAHLLRALAEASAYGGDLGATHFDVDADTVRLTVPRRGDPAL